MAATAQAANAPASATLAEVSVGERRTPLMESVGEIPPAELEAHIKSLGRLIERAMRLGDRANAVELQRAMYAAIRSRSPATQAEMQAAIDKRIDEGVCYFSSDAAQAQGKRAMGARS